MVFVDHVFKKKSRKMTKLKEKREPLPTKIYNHEKPIPFVENFKWSDLNATFTAESFTNWMYNALPVMKTLKPVKRSIWKEAEKKGVVLGDDKVFYLRPFPIWHYTAPFRFMKERPTRGALDVYRGTTTKTVAFDNIVYIPVLANKQMAPWMSLTPNEVFTLRGQIRRAKNDVAMAGLGLGWVARKVLERKQVKHLTIYEKDKSIVDFFGKSLLEDFPDRVTLVHVDAYDVDWLKHDVALWDIWMEYGDAAWDKKYKEIRDNMKSNGKICIGWGEGLQ